MDDRILTRIADALDRIAPPPPAEIPDDAPAYRWQKGRLTAAGFEPLPLALLSGIDRQRDAVLANLRRLASGHAAHDMLLWGSRGSGKSAIVKSSVRALQDEGLPLVLVEVAADSLGELGAVFDAMAFKGRPVLIFIDDLGFDGDLGQARALRSMLDGGATARWPSVRLAVTSNRRHIVPRDLSEQDSAINPRDVADDRLALADRFGLSLGFHLPDQDQWLGMVENYAGKFALPFDRADALEFATTRGTRSGRTAWHYTVEVAGRVGKPLEPVG
jgi:predicted AAA+ superfamily ATPase